MKKHLMIGLLVMFSVFSCSKDDEVTNEVQGDDFELNTAPIDNMAVDLLAEEDKGSAQRKSDASGSAGNPIIVAPSDFVDYVDYTVETCSLDANGNREVANLERFRGLFYGTNSSGITPNRDEYALTSAGCYEITKNAQDVDEYQFGKFYKIFGQTVQLSSPSNLLSGFWFRQIPNSNQVEEVTFFENGTFQVGQPKAFPFQRDLNCNGLRALPQVYNSLNFRVGDLRVSEGTFLYRFDGIFFRFIGVCSTNTVSEDICDGVDQWRFGKRYRSGDQVTFFGYLFTKLNRGWRREGRCG